MTSPSKIICIGRNFREHAQELKNPIPENPVIFLKPPSSLCSPETPIQYPEFTANLQYECEIVLQITRKGKNITRPHAADHATQWTVGLDLTARDIQQTLKKEGLPWELAKAFDQSAVVGRFVPVNLHRPERSRFSLQLNGRLVQQGDTGDMIFSFTDIIHFASRYFTLQEGDLIFTGTPAGVGGLHPGDQLTGHLNDLCLLSQSVL